MKLVVRIGLVLAVSVAALLSPGCYPKTCAPNDPTCWPCDNPANQNPGCVEPWTPIPVEAQRPDGGTR